VTRRRRSIRVPPSPDVSVCKAGGCAAPILLLRHERTGNIAAIDLRPAPDGNIEINRRAGTYAVVHAHKPRAARYPGDPTLEPEQLALDDGSDPVAAGLPARPVEPDDDLDAAPRLHLNHYLTCKNATAVRLARQRERGHHQ
jgi:hypothetical protein